jgi:hypothetical protein
LEARRGGFTEMMMQIEGGNENLFDQPTSFVSKAYTYLKR